MRYTFKYTLFLTFFLFVKLTFSYDKNLKVPNLSDASKISLLTVGRNDDEIWQNFGHTAIRVKDSVFGWDLVYNYGTFNFGESYTDFVKQFILGTLKYYESIDNYSEFEEMYREENRWIREQELNLNQAQKQLLFEKLTINAREENKYYRYDFLFDNCSTRPRDIVLSVFENKTFSPDVDDETTYRSLIDRNVPNEWLDFGMDLLIGIPTDKKSGYGRTFLPLELMELFDGAKVDAKPLVLSNEILLNEVPEYHKNYWFNPGLLFWILFALIVFIQTKTAFFSKHKWIPVLYLSFLGILGWLFVFMWFFTAHQTTKWNLNILWAMPLNFPFIFLAMKKQLPQIIKTYIKVYRILLVVLLIGWWVNPQSYHQAVIPLILIAILFTSIFFKVPVQQDFKKRWFG